MECDLPLSDAVVDDGDGTKQRNSRKLSSYSNQLVTDALYTNLGGAVVRALFLAARRSAQIGRLRIARDLVAILKPFGVGQTDSWGDRTSTQETADSMRASLSEQATLIGCCCRGLIFFK